MMCVTSLVWIGVTLTAKRCAARICLPRWFCCFLSLSEPVVLSLLCLIPARDSHITLSEAARPKTNFFVRAVPETLWGAAFSLLFNSAMWPGVGAPRRNSTEELRLGAICGAAICHGIRFRPDPRNPAAAQSREGIGVACLSTGLLGRGCWGSQSRACFAS